MSLLQENDLENFIEYILRKLNKYISCDKTILYLLMIVIKFCEEKIKKKIKQKIFDYLFNSLLLYFYEFKNFEYRKDNIMLTNFV